MRRKYVLHAVIFLIFALKKTGNTIKYYLSFEFYLLRAEKAVARITKAGDYICVFV